MAKDVPTPILVSLDQCARLTSLSRTAINRLNFSGNRRKDDLGIKAQGRQGAKWQLSVSRFLS